MAFDGSGNFNRLYSWVTDALGGLFINATKMDQEMNGFATGLSDCVTRDGQSPPSANLPMNGKKLTGLGVGSAGTDSASIADITSRLAVAEWQAFSGATLSFIGATQFKTLGLDTTATFCRGRRVKIVVTAGTLYANVKASTFAVDTLVTLDNMWPFNLDAGLSAANYSILSNNPTAAPQMGYALFRAGSDQAVTINVDTQLTTISAAIDVLGECSGATYTPLENGMYLITVRVATVAFGPTGMLFINDGIVTNATGIIPVNYGGSAEFGTFFPGFGVLVVQLLKGSTYNFRIQLNASVTIKATYTQVTVARIA